MYFYTLILFLYTNQSIAIFLSNNSLYTAAKSPHPHQRIRYTKEINKRDIQKNFIVNQAKKSNCYLF